MRKHLILATVAAGGLALAACGQSQETTRAQDASPGGSDPATTADGTSSYTSGGAAPTGDTAVPPGTTGSTGTGEAGQTTGAPSNTPEPATPPQ